MQQFEEVEQFKDFAAMEQETSSQEFEDKWGRMDDQRVETS